MSIYRNVQAQGARFAAAVALATLCLDSPAWAGGILIYEAGQEGNGLANAGSAALANDPSVLMSNPEIGRAHV